MITYCIDEIKDSILTQRIHNLLKLRNLLQYRKNHIVQINLFNIDPHTTEILNKFYHISNHKISSIGDILPHGGVFHPSPQLNEQLPFEVVVHLKNGVNKLINLLEFFGFFHPIVKTILRLKSGAPLLNRPTSFLAVVLPDVLGLLELQITALHVVRLLLLLLRVLLLLLGPFLLQKVFYSIYQLVVSG